MNIYFLIGSCSFYSITNNQWYILWKKIVEYSLNYLSNEIIKFFLNICKARPTPRSCCGGVISVILSYHIIIIIKRIGLDRTEWLDYGGRGQSRFDEGSMSSNSNASVEWGLSSPEIVPGDMQRYPINYIKLKLKIKSNQEDREIFEVWISPDMKILILAEIKISIDWLVDRESTQLRLVKNGNPTIKIKKNDYLDTQISMPLSPPAGNSHRSLFVWFVW